MAISVIFHLYPLLVAQFVPPVIAIADWSHWMICGPVEQMTDLQCHISCLFNDEKHAYIMDI